MSCNMLNFKGTNGQVCIDIRKTLAVVSFLVHQPISNHTNSKPESAQS